MHVMTSSVFESHSHCKPFQAIFFRICGTSRGSSASVELLVLCLKASAEEKLESMSEWFCHRRKYV